MRYKSVEEGLNAYGAVTWGQFFFTRVLTSGWMHTSSSVDVSDMYAEKIVIRNEKVFYEYDGQLHLLLKKSL
jgi:acyl-homoserine lactone acylase PvdQ